MKVDRGLLIALVAVLAVLIAGFVVLSTYGRDVSTYALFLGGPVVSAIVGAVLAQRTSRVEATVQQVKHQTNSLLTAHLDSITGQLDAAAVDRADKSRTRPEA